MLLSFYEIQSWIEFLSATIYFVTSGYLIYLLTLKWHIPEKERKLIRELSLGFLAISAVFSIRQIIYHSVPEASFFKSDLSNVLLMMLLVLPAQCYCSSSIGFYDFTLKGYLFNLVIMTIINISVPSEPDKIYLYIFLLLFLVNNIFLFYKFCQKMHSLIKKEESSIIMLKNDIFIFVSVTLFSLILIILILFEFKCPYIKIVLSIFSIINVLLFVKVVLPYSSKSILNSAAMIDELTCLQEERHRINRQLTDNIKTDELYNRLLKYFENEKPYLKPDLKIKEVALYLYTNKTYLSRIINDKNNQNFNQFVNYYRIEEVKKLFNDNNKLNIQELCYLSGFGSMATFSIAFRFHMGYTPADWCKEQKLKTHNG
ncbi:MAG: AraC family transcriptional regulator [Bacteroidales bacterium]